MIYYFTDFASCINIYDFVDIFKSYFKRSVKSIRELLFTICFNVTNVLTAIIINIRSARLAQSVEHQTFKADCTSAI